MMIGRNETQGRRGDHHDDKITKLAHKKQSFSSLQHHTYVFVDFRQFHVE